MGDQSELCNDCSGMEYSLINASHRGHDKCLVLLVQSGADVNHQGMFGDTALVEAAQGGYVKCVELLIQAGANVNMQDHNGQTAVYYAARFGYMECVKMLISAGACVKSLTHKILGHGKCGEILVAAGAPVSHYVEKKILQVETEIRLTSLCRDVIRNHLKKMNNMNLFLMVPRLGLPKPLERFLLYNISIHDDEN